MKAPIFIRELTEDEQEHIQAGLRSPSAFVLRRCQIVLASTRGRHATAIARELGCDDQTVRNVISGFNERGLDVLIRGSCCPHHLRTRLPDDVFPTLRALLHRSPRDFGIERSLWSLPAVATVCFEQGLTSVPISGACVRRTLARHGISWKRAKHWITSPDPLYEVKKTRAIA